MKDDGYDTGRYRVYDPEHDALWRAIGRLRMTVSVLGVAVVVALVAELWR